MNIACATLVYNTPDLALRMEQQIAGIWIVDNGSDVYIPYRVFRFDENLGFVKGWNELMHRVVSDDLADYVWMLNSDVEHVGTQMAQKLGMLLYRYQDIAAITPSFNSPHGLFWGQGQGQRHVSWIDWCCPMVSVSAWKAIGPFDERSTGYFADIDWCARATRAGYGLMVDDDVQVNHLGSKTIGAMGKMWDASDQWLRDKWGVGGWQELV